MSIDWSKPIQTRRGEPARLLGEIEGVGFTHFVAVKRKVGDEVGYGVFASGHASSQYSNSDQDIMNVPEEAVWYVNIADPDYGMVRWRSRESTHADPSGVLGRVKVTLIDGKPVRAELI